jgi:hypothetical protein
MNINFPYVFPRIVRHFLPERFTRFLLHRGWIIHPGLETSAPRAAVERYIQTLQKHDASLSNKRVLVFGYGGNFAVGCKLLRAGASHVVLVDAYAPPDDRQNRELLPEFKTYLSADGQRVQPCPEVITLIQDDIRQVTLSPVDVILSTSVYEHLEDIRGITLALARLTSPDGIHVHFIDMRDHFFKYPFEMLCYSERTWRMWLNPTSNLNRCRLPDYQQIFGEIFMDVDVEILESDDAALHAVRSRIQPQYLTGDDEMDATTQICIVACHPQNQ